ncbi:MAG TPA: DUF1772 domain-containing protein [Burkholderiales bacterium]|nr:DUF1772 domain-containing protein [Burkholderiales bacterium]
MMLPALRTANIFLVALLAGGMFVIWAGYDPMHLSPATYVEQQKNAIRGLNVLMPALGAITIALTLLSAALQRDNRRVLVLLVVAAAFLVAAGLITRFGNQPINAIVMEWDVARPAANWTELRDQWWGYHKLRTICGLIALVLIAWTGVRPGGTGR